MDDELESIRKRYITDILNNADKKEAKKMEPVVLTDRTFDEALKNDKILVVDFWATWCAPCRFLSPVIEELAGEYAGRINFGKVDVDENPHVSAKFDIRSIPTVIMFKNGKVVDTSIGAVPKQMLEAKLKRLLN
jgi:thioredoxin 1